MFLLNPHDQETLHKH